MKKPPACSGSFLQRRHSKLSKDLQRHAAASADSAPPADGGGGALNRRGRQKRKRRTEKQRDFLQVGADTRTRVELLPGQQGGAPSRREAPQQPEDKKTSSERRLRLQQRTPEEALLGAWLRDLHRPPPTGRVAVALNTKQNEPMR